MTIANYLHLKWDSDFFGFKVARIINDELDDAALSKTLKHLRNAGYRLVYWLFPVSYEKAFRIAISHGGLLVDEKVTYIKEVNALSYSEKVSLYKTVPYSGVVADDALIKLSLLSSEYSRFRFDQNFSRELSEKLYTCWISRSVSREIASEVLVIKNINDYLGMITLGTKNGRGDIGLVAVAEDSRCKGLGRILVNDAERYFIEKNICLAQVVTQKNNHGACRLYELCGYHIEKIENVFHLWI